MRVDIVDTMPEEITAHAVGFALYNTELDQYVRIPLENEPKGYKWCDEAQWLIMERDLCRMHNDALTEFMGTFVDHCVLVPCEYFIFKHGSMIEEQVVIDVFIVLGHDKSFKLSTVVIDE